MRCIACNVLLYGSELRSKHHELSGGFTDMCNNCSRQTYTFDGVIVSDDGKISFTPVDENDPFFKLHDPLGEVPSTNPLTEDEESY